VKDRAEFDYSNVWFKYKIIIKKINEAIYSFIA